MLYIVKSLQDISGDCDRFIKCFIDSMHSDCYDIISGLRQVKSILLVTQEVVIDNFLVDNSLKKMRMNIHLYSNKLSIQPTSSKDLGDIFLYGNSETISVGLGIVLGWRILFGPVAFVESRLFYKFENIP